MSSKFKCLLIIIFLLVTNPCVSQKTNYIGLDFTVENSSGNFKPGLGLVFERRITRHSGIETGLFYRNYNQDFIITVSDSVRTNSYYGIVSERHLSLPVAYKFYSRIINLSAGPTFDFYMGWKQKNKTSSFSIDTYNIDPSFFVGFIAKASKEIRIDKFILEPEIRFNPIFTSGRKYIGFGIAGKYKL